MKRLALTAIAVALAAGCSSSSEPQQRFAVESEGFSIEQPANWSPHRDHGAVIFVSPENPRRTIAIRAVLASDPTVQHKAVDATKVVLDGLPEVEVTSAKRLEGPLPGTAYELTFLPPGSKERYARTHVVLVGDQHVFHVIETVPASEARRDSTVRTVIASFREEV